MRSKKILPVLLLAILMLPQLLRSQFYWEVMTNVNDIRDLLVRGDTLYAATSGGLLLYDLNDGHYRPVTSSDGITDQDFISLTYSEQGTIILGTQNGSLTFFRPATETFYQDRSLAGNQIIALQALQDTLWVVTKKMVAVYLYDHEKEQFLFRDFFQNFNQDFTEFRAVALFQNRIYIASDIGLYSAPSNFLRYNLKAADNWNLLTTNDGLSNDNLFSLNSTSDTLYIGSDNGMMKYYAGTFSTFRNGLNPARVKHIVLSGGHLYVDNGTTIYRLDGNLFHSLAQAPYYRLIAFTVDNQAHLWGAVEDKGLRDFTARQRVWLNSPIDNHIARVFLDSQRRLWVLTSRVKEERKKGFSVLENGQWRNFKYIDKWINMSSANTIMEDSEGNIWLGSWGAGITVIDRDFQFHHINTLTDPGRLWISSLTEDDSLVVNPPDSARDILSGVIGHPTVAVVTDFLLDPVNHSIWILNITPANRKPLIQIHQTFFGPEIYDPANRTYWAFPVNVRIEQDAIYSITQDIFGINWIGTASSGVVAMQLQEGGDTGWLWLTEKDDLKNNFAWEVAADQDGYVWIGTSAGLSAYFNGVVYDFREDYQPIGLNIQDIFVDSQNNKWFATDKGLSLLKASGSPWDKNSWVHFVPMQSEFFGDNIYHSNLPSENVIGVFVDDRTGDVYCGTASGLAILRNNPFTTPRTKLDEVKAGPIPFVINGNGSNYFYLRNLTANSQVKILTPSGRLVRVLDSADRSEVLGSLAQWDGRNEEGRLVSTGVYIYLVTDEEGNATRGKLVVIRE